MRIKLRQEDHKSLRFYWRNGEARDPDVYEFSSVPFGSKSSPYLAQAVKNFKAMRFKEKYPEAVEVITNNHYVDDLMKSFNSDDEAVQILKQVIHIHSEGGFNIRGFLSNSLKVMKSLNSEKFEECTTLDIGDEKFWEKVLGMWWNLLEDMICFRFKANKVDPSVLDFIRPPTRCELLSIVMSVFDPMGFIAHYLSYAKVIMREVVKQGANWEQPIDDEAWTKFKVWWARLKNLETVKINRWYSHRLDAPKTVQLHVFSDASVDLYAAVAYIRVEDQNGFIDVSLIGAKTRVAPIKLMSIPRLELQGAVLAVRWSMTLINSHEITFEKVYFHVDSTTVLDWIACKDPRKYKQFVAFRISEILSSTTIDQWRYVPSKMNIADDATKFVNVNENPEEDRWFSGDSFLKLPESEWPTRRVKEDTQAELKAAHVMVHRAITNRFAWFKVDKPDENTGAMRKWNRVVSTVAYVFRAIKNFKLRNHDERDQLPFVRASERTEAETFLLKKAQWESFADDIVVLTKRQQLSSKSEIKDLSPEIMSDGLIRMRSRLEFADYLPDSVKFPIILSRCHEITKLIVQDVHERFLHQSHEAVVQEIAQKFQIKALRQLLKEVRRSCSQCQRDAAKPRAPEMAPLPKPRIEPFVKPFTHTGVDAFGPYDVIIGRTVHKRYGIIFTCMSCRAVAIELANDLSADAFILTLRNFMNRNGRAMKFMYSDNGTNFTAASRILRNVFQSILRETQVGEEASRKGIEFKFNCPDNAHAGGVWEREVRSIKRVLDKLIKSSKLKEPTLRSFLVEAENIVNSQPLTYVPITNESEPALTPNTLLYGYNDNPPSFGNYKLEDVDTALKRWKTSQALADNFWTRWVKEYLPELTRRTKWHDKVESLKVGDIVLICDPKGKRHEYKRGRIVEVKETRSGQNREFKVLCGGCIYSRPAVHLAKLDIYQPQEVQTSFGDRAQGLITGVGVGKSSMKLKRIRNNLRN